MARFAVASPDIQALGPISLYGERARMESKMEELTQDATQDDQESVWDVYPSLKGPPAAHGSI